MKRIFLFVIVLQMGVIFSIFYDRWDEVRKNEKGIRVEVPERYRKFDFMQIHDNARKPELPYFVFLQSKAREFSKLPRGEEYKEISATQISQWLEVAEAGGIPRPAWIDPALNDFLHEGFYYGTTIDPTTSVVESYSGKYAVIFTGLDSR